MDVTLTDDQQLLRATAANLAHDLGCPSADALDHLDTDVWTPLVALGLPALRSPELSGVDATGVEIALVVEEFGRTLSAAPTVGQAVLVPDLLVAAGADAVLERVADGELRLAPAFRTDLTGLATLGDHAVAVDARGASHALLLDDERRLAAVTLGEDPLNPLDLTRALIPIASGSIDDDIGDLGGAIDDASWAAAQALLLTTFAADLVGVMQGALDDAVGYVAERRQFGVPVGTFQAVQHLAADALVQLEGARSCCWYAAWAVDRLPPDEALLAAHVANGYASRAGLAVVEATVQMFGGIAITWEQASHLRLRRALFDRQVGGDEAVQYAEVARLRLARPELN
jgi:alkylation response protein AidB-like acyl-CoA dehydrogenase